VLTCGEIASFCDRLLAFDAVSDAELRSGYKPADKMSGCLTFCLCGMLWPPLMPLAGGDNYRKFRLWN
jgi:hypothetical protein